MEETDMKITKEQLKAIYGKENRKNKISNV